MPRRCKTSIAAAGTCILISIGNIGVSGFSSPWFVTSINTHPHRLASVPSPPSLRKGTKLSAVVAGVSGAEDNGEQPVQYIRGGGRPSNAVGRWPSFDAVDSRLIKIGLPCILNFAIVPLVGAVDLFWVNRMGNPLAVAGQSAANQVVNSAFWLFSFLPSVTATLVAKEAAKGDKEALQDAVCQALFVGAIIALIGTPLMLLFSDGVLGVVLKKGAPALEFAKPYLVIRSCSFLFQMLSIVGFSAFRGMLDTVTPVKISIFANIFNAVLDPVLIFSLAMGVPGAAIATLAAEMISAVTYISLMRRKQMIRFRKIFSIPSWQKLQPLLKGGAALQLRNFALNLTFLAVTRVTQSIDDTGVAAAAHALAIQTFQVGGIVLLALSTVAQTVVPSELVEMYDEDSQRTMGGVYAARAVVNRLMSWALLLGTFLGIFQLAILPTLHMATPMLEVRETARLPSYLASFYQAFNGMVFVGEGVMIGCGNYLQLSLSTLVATAGCLLALKTLPQKYGLAGVWIGFGVFNTLRLLGVIIHQTRTGPLASKNLRKASNPID